MNCLVYWEIYISLGHSIPSFDFQHVGNHCCVFPLHSLYLWIIIAIDPCTDTCNVFSCLSYNSNLEHFSFPSIVVLINFSIQQMDKSMYTMWTKMENFCLLVGVIRWICLINICNICHNFVHIGIAISLYWPCFALLWWHMCMAQQAECYSISVLIPLVPSCPVVPEKTVAVVWWQKLA